MAHNNSRRSRRSRRSRKQKGGVITLPGTGFIMSPGGNNVITIPAARFRNGTKTAINADDFFENKMVDYLQKHNIVIKDTDGISETLRDFISSTKSGWLNKITDTLTCDLIHNETWTGYNRTPTIGDTVSLENNARYKLLARNGLGQQMIGSYLEYIKKEGDIWYEEIWKRIMNIVINDNIDGPQLSTFITHNFTNMDNRVEIDKFINGGREYPIPNTNYTVFYDKVKKIFLIIRTEGEKVAIKYHLVEQKEDTYHISPHNLLNHVALNPDKDRLITLFDQITKKLNEIVPTLPEVERARVAPTSRELINTGRTIGDLPKLEGGRRVSTRKTRGGRGDPYRYTAGPDEFFHIHVTTIPSKPDTLLLTLHTKYEVATQRNENLHFTYRNRAGVNHPIVRGKRVEGFSTNEKRVRRGEHSFYLLFNLSAKRNNNFRFRIPPTTTHQLYSLKQDNNIVFPGAGIGIDQILGRTLFDINHINGKGVVISLSDGRCEEQSMACETI